MRIEQISNLKHQIGHLTEIKNETDEQNIELLEHVESLCVMFFFVFIANYF
jgi:hypothetical protein